MTEMRGVLIDWLDTEYSQAVVRSASEYCRPRGISLIVLTLGSLGADQNQEDILRQLLALGHDHGFRNLIVCSAQLSSRGLLPLLERVLSQQTALNAVGLGAPLGRVPYVRSEGRRAFWELLDHLWKDHGYRRMAWVSGPRRNRESQEREQVFLEYLRENGLPVVPRLMHEGNFQRSSGRAAGRELAQTRTEWDVVVAANDGMALGLQEILGDSAPITGFDNGMASRHAGLTTVDPRLSLQVQTLLALTAESPPPPEVEGQLVIRRSCGCRPASEWQHPGFQAADPFGERMGDLGASIENAADQRALAATLNEVLPHEGIGYWKLLAPNETQREPLLTSGVLPADVGGSPFELVVHTLSRGSRPCGFLALDIRNRDYFLSEWLRQSLNRLVETWHQKGEEAEVQKILSFEIAKLAHSKKEFQQVVHGLPLWMIELDRHWGIRYLNQAAGALLGLSPGEGRHESLLRFLSPADADRVQARLKSCLNSGEVRGSDFVFLRRDGSSIPVIAQLEPLGTDLGRPLTSLMGSLSFEAGVRICGLEVRPIVEGVTQPEQQIFQHYTFSNREKDVILRVSKGRSIVEMAEELGLSVNTVKGYLHHIYIKTGVRNRREFFSVLETYQEKSFEANSLTQVLLSRILGRSEKARRTQP